MTRVFAVLLMCLLTGRLLSQSVTDPSSPAPPSTQSQWQVAAGGTMMFEAASIRKDTSGKFKAPSFAFNADDGLPPSDGTFYGDFPLIVYIQFAYKQWFTPEETRSLYAGLPKWVVSDSYEIRAQGKGKPSKDQMRLMTQSMLADRFGLKVHFESRQLPVFEMTLTKPGKTGPRLRPHTSICDGTPSAKVPAPGAVFPPPCLDQALMTIPRPNHVKLTGTRNTMLALIATYLPSIGELDRPVVDDTGLAGRYDFSLEFTPDSGLPVPSDTEPDAQATTFHEALAAQLGLQLKPARAARDVLVIDRVERPEDDQTGSR